ncbi:MAG TPA: nuclear transport factor 2 family protein [Acidobacteriaceae bacterium]
MRLTRLFALSLFALLLTLPAAAQKSASADEASIRAVLSRQAADWNRGDLDAFAAGYKNSPDILFIGSTVRRGYDGMIASYRKNYPNKSAMGVLTFSNVEVHPLDARFATVIGNFHLERTAAGGGNANGFYSLVLEKTTAGWKIVLDHTTSTTH